MKCGDRHKSLTFLRILKKELEAKKAGYRIADIFFVK